jgi:thymidylate synthase
VEQYRELLLDVLANGHDKQDRTGTGTRSVFGRQARFSVNNTLPLVTLKKTNYDAVLAELLWFVRGQTNIKTLNSKIWDEWATESGDLGPIYGAQWRGWDLGTNPAKQPNAYYCDYTDSMRLDQLSQAIDMLRKKPDSRRIIVSAWNPAYLPNESLTPQENVKLGRMALAPCHTLFQFYTHKSDNTRYLSLHLYQRSADLFLGVPFNIASYATLLRMAALCTGMTPHELIISFGDLHLYHNHIDLARQVAMREAYPPPKLLIEYWGQEYLHDFESSDFELIDYKYNPPVRAPISV